MEEKKMCPLLSISTGEDFNVQYCRKKQCSWWYSRKEGAGNLKTEMCSILKIADALRKQQK